MLAQMTSMKVMIILLEESFDESGLEINDTKTTKGDITWKESHR